MTILLSRGGSIKAIFFSRRSLSKFKFFFPINEFTGFFSLYEFGSIEKFRIVLSNVAIHTVVFHSHVSLRYIFFSLHSRA